MRRNGWSNRKSIPKTMLPHTRETRRVKSTSQMWRDITNKSEWASQHQKKPSTAHMLITNAHSHQRSPSEVDCCQESSSHATWREQSSSEETTSTSFQNIKDTKRDTKTSPSTSHQLSDNWRKVITSSWDNADHSQRLSDSTSSSSHQEDQVTRNSLLSSKLIIYLFWIYYFLFCITSFFGSCRKMLFFFYFDFFNIFDNFFYIILIDLIGSKNLHLKIHYSTRSTEINNYL